MMQLSQVSQAVKGEHRGADPLLNGISINTRAECEGRLFVALKGANFDAHDFIEQAQRAGAGAALVEQELSVDLPNVVVPDTHQALRDLATWWREQFVIPVIGITGSVGKTTVKEMLGSIFAQLGPGVVTEGNLNNEIGVPLTLMRLNKDARYAVVEMGMNQRGEISRITAMAKPTIAMINNAAAAHLEGLGSIEGVAQAKGEIFEGLTADGVAVINADDEYAPLWKTLAGKHRVFSFGLSPSADVWASYQSLEQALEITVHIGKLSKKIKLHALGEHSVRNALAAIAVAYAANIPFKAIKAGLSAYRPIAGRLVPQKLANITLFDDTYNANPMSMRAAIDVLADYSQSTLIIGDMAELGDAAQQEHIKLGRYAAEKDIKHMLVYGKFAKWVAHGFAADAQVFEDQQSLIAYAVTQVHKGAVLVKGSRSAQMEHVVHALQNKNKSAETARLGEH